MALVGAGSRSENHARILAELGALGAVYDAVEDAARECGHRYSASHHTSLDALMSSEFDAALVCVHMHPEAIARLVRAKKDILVDGSVTYQSREIDPLMELAERNRTLLLYGCTGRFNPAVAKARDLVMSGTLGSLAALEFHRHKAPPHAGGAGVIRDAAAQDMDSAVWLFGQTPEMVFARSGSMHGGCDDHAVVVLGFGDGKMATVSSGWISPLKEQTFSAICANAVVSGDAVSQEIRIRTPAATRDATDPWRDPLQCEIEGFLAAAAGKTRPPADAREAVNAAKMLEAALLSNESGTPIYLESR